MAKWPAAIDEGSLLPVVRTGSEIAERERWRLSDARINGRRARRPQDGAVYHDPTRRRRVTASLGQAFRISGEQLSLPVQADRGAHLDA
jgi:hypothetical protein